ncbi:recombinase family protein [Cytobacillus sp. Hm23]
MEELNIIAVYGRVSSATQSLELQETAAIRYLKSIGLNGDEDLIHFFRDKDVSATQLPMTKRSDLMKVIDLIKNGKVKKLIVYKRDRLFRNFYECVDINRIFFNNGVEVVYTASNEPPFSGKLSVEALYGIFSQVEGENIRTRTADARMLYPSRIFGYKRIKGKEQGKENVKYVINHEQKKSIEVLFKDLKKVENEDQFFEVLIKRRKGINNVDKILKILRNPFYSGHHKSHGGGYQPLSYVEPIISLKLFTEVNEIINSFYTQYKNKVHDVNAEIQFIPQCGMCKQVMKHKKKNVLDVGYFVCSSKHKRNFMDIKEFNDVITQTVLEHVENISPSISKRLMEEGIKLRSKELVREQKKISKRCDDLSIEISIRGKSKGFNYQQILKEIYKLKKQYNLINNDLASLLKLKYEIKDIKAMIFDFVHDLEKLDLFKLIKLLVKKAIIYDDHVSVELFLAKYMKEVETS